ncbi:MAG: hypothetical protein ACOQNV_01075 [Mycoplasmoidaceae bacterium]
MKLKSKFIPIIASCAVISTIAPITLTSCSEGSSGEFKYLDLVKKHIPTNYSPLESEEPLSTFEVATEKYINWIKKNKSYFTDDWGYGTYWNWMQTLPPKNLLNPMCYSAKLTDLKVGTNEPRFGTTFVQYPGRGEAIEYPTISVDVQFHADFSMEFLNVFKGPEKSEDYPSSSTYKIDYTLDVTSKIDNMLFFVKTNGLDVNYKELSLKKDTASDGVNAWNVTTFDRGSNSAYEYRTDNWGMDVKSVCQRKIDVIEESQLVKTESCTNSFSANINNLLLFNYVQQVLMEGNEIFSELMSFPATLGSEASLDEEEYLKYRLDNLIDQLTGINSGGMAQDQVDFLIYTASAATIDFASFYLSQEGAPYSFNTYNPLTVTRAIPEDDQDLEGPFHFYNYFNLTDGFENSGYSPWSLEKPSDSTRIDNDTKKIEKIELDLDDGEVVRLDEINQVNPDFKLALVLTGFDNSDVIFNNNGQTSPLTAAYDDPKRPVSPLLLEGHIYKVKPDGTLDMTEEYAYTPDDMKSGYDSFRLLLTNEIPVKITYDDSTVEPGDTHILVDTPIATINFSDEKK